MTEASDPVEPARGELLAARMEGWAGKLKPRWAVAVAFVRKLALVVAVATVVLVAAMFSLVGPLGLVAVVVGLGLGWALWRIRRPLVALGDVLDNIGPISRSVPGRFEALEAQLRELSDRTEGKRRVNPVAMVRFVRQSRTVWDDLTDVPEVDMDGLRSAMDPRMGIALAWTFMGIPLLVAVAALLGVVALVVAVV